MGFQVGFPALRNYPASTGPYVFVDADASNYASRVATADSQELEDTTKAAIDTLFLTLKNTITWRSNSITLWDKLNYSLPMRGPRTLDGALVPLQNRTAATAIQSGNFTYNRKTGIEVTSIDTQHPVINIGGSVFTEAAQDDRSFLLYVDALPSPRPGTGYSLMRASTNQRDHIQGVSEEIKFKVSGSAVLTVTGGLTNVGQWKGATRIDGTDITYRVDGSSTTAALASGSSGTSSTEILLFASSTTGSQPPGVGTRLAGFNHGDDMDLAALESAFNAYFTAINSAF